VIRDLGISFKPSYRSWCAWVVGILAGILYMFVYVNTPLVVMIWQNYDDNLFIRLGQYLASGHWLGPYSQFTLMKGPGYPAFLAANYWSGLPITFTQGLFCCLALAALSLVTFRATRSRLVALAIFVVPLLDPRVFEVSRVLRDCIYFSQSILIIAVVSYCLFLSNGIRTRLISAIIAGALFGWFWLTREEGVWLLPAITVLGLFALLRKKRYSEACKILPPALIGTGAFVLVLVLFATINFFIYGMFIGVDFKERNFQAALSAMESVQIAKPIPYVNVPRAARAQIYAISPHFAELRPYLDPNPGPSPWEAGDCLHRPTACGDIGNGFFIWAVRDAAAKVGVYKSPKDASRFYKAISKEIRSACTKRQLRCVKNFVPYMPRMTRSQIEQIPRSAIELLRDMVHPGMYSKFADGHVTGPKDEFRSALDFLNYPLHYPISNSHFTAVAIRGWYHDPKIGDQWFSVTVSDKGDKALPFTLIRIASPDLVESQHDENATQQRFSLRTQCGAGCVLHFASADGGTRDVAISSSTALTAQYLPIGSGLLVFDSGAVENEATVYDDGRVRLASRIRAVLYPIFEILLPVLLGLGTLSFFGGCYMAVRKRNYPIILAVAAACWVSVLTRSVILVLIDVSSFPAMITPYLLPIYVLSVVASILSLSVMRKRWTFVDQTGTATQTSDTSCVDG